MKKIVIAALVAAMALMSNIESVNAQNASEGQVLNQVKAKNLISKAEIKWQSDGMPVRKAGVLSEAAQHTYFYSKEWVRIAVPAERDGRTDTLEVYLPTKVRRLQTSGWSGGITLGCSYAAGDITPTAGIEGEFAGKVFVLGADVELALPKYNEESSRSGHFLSTRFTGRVGWIFAHYSVNKLDNMGWIAAGYEFRYNLEKNENEFSNTYQSGGDLVTQSSKFVVEGSSMGHCGFIETRFAGKRMGTVSYGIRAYAGAYNRYYYDGYRRKFMCGVNFSIHFNGAKKRVDNEVARFQSSLESGDTRMVNEFVNQLRATVK
jgi:hypothetical protein